MSWELSGLIREAAFSLLSTWDPGAPSSVRNIFIVFLGACYTKDDHARLNRRFTTTLLTANCSVSHDDRCLVPTRGKTTICSTTGPCAIILTLKSCDTSSITSERHDSGVPMQHK